MEYRHEFDICDFEFYGKARGKVRYLSFNEMLLLEEFVEKHFEEWMPSMERINQFVSEECDEFFEDLRHIRIALGKIEGE